MEIIDGTIEDVVHNLGLIHDLIPAKADLTADEVRERLSETTHGIKIVKEDKLIHGIFFVWYESENSLYLWLGATKIQGKGIGGDVLNRIKEETDYRRWYVKTGEDNKHTLAHLNKFGFKEYKNENGIVYLERFF